MPSVVVLASGFVVHVCAVVRRAMNQFSPMSVREELASSRRAPLDHQARKGDE